MKYYKNLQLKDLDGEIWIDALGYDGIYQVSNLGRIKSLERTVLKSNGMEMYVKERIMVQSLQKDGRLTCNFSMHGSKKSINISACIFYSFNSEFINDNLTDEVYHKNKIADDNRLVNLGYNKIKGKSYKISIELGNVKHMERMWNNGYHHEHSTKTAVFKNNKTIKRLCKVCNKLKSQESYEEYGRNTCKKCRSNKSRLLYEKKLILKGKKRKNNKDIKITDTVTGEIYISSNKKKCIIGVKRINDYADTGKLVYPYNNSKHKNPLLVETVIRT